MTSCTILPHSGPSTTAIEKKQSKVLLSGYQLIDVNENVVRALNGTPRASFSYLAGAKRSRRAGTIGIGDVVAVTIWESAAGGLFSEASADGAGGGAKHTTLPEQPVSGNGTIAVPYGGNILVAGLTAEQAGERIAQALRDKAIGPQAMLVVTRSVGSGISLVGAVGRPGRVPLAPGGSRLLDSLADAGGFTGAEYEASIQLNRGTQVAKVPLSTVLERSYENISLQPGDIVTVMREPMSFTVFGATGVNNKIPFGTAHLSLNQALGLSSGLSDMRADTRSVFVMRYEQYKTIKAILPAGQITATPIAGAVPVIYRFDLSDPGGFLLADQFQMENKDIVYISNASLSDVQKFVSLLTTVVQVPSSVGGTPSSLLLK